jgi:nicotinate-nucleotide adenylyltransferase
MKKKGIFGGTFDPIHNGHLYIAYEALNQLGLDEVIFMPSGNPPHKTQKNITDGNIRYELVKAATRCEGRFAVSDYEIRKKGLSFTYETVEFLNKAGGDGTEWYFITGADCLMDLNGWKNVDRIFNACTFVVFNRPGYDKNSLLEQKKAIESRYGKKIRFLDLLLLEISSSGIRESIRAGREVGYFLPGGVYNTVKQLGLYK